MDRILVINMTRMGDIIQSGPLISGLRQRHPRAHLGLLVLKSFSKIAALLPDLDEVLTLDQDEAVGMLLDPDHTLTTRASRMLGLVRGLRGVGWDLVFNLTHSRDSAVLAHLLARGEVRGIHIHPDGRQRVEHDWARYFFCVTGNRAVNQFNLVDIYRRIGDLSPHEGVRLSLTVGSEAAARVDSMMSSLVKGEQAPPVILLQPGASRDNRRWPVERLAETMRILHQGSGAVFIIAGTKGEQDLAQELLACAAGVPGLSLAGLTSVEELAALCSRASLLITNDTGTLHVAAARGTPSVSLFFATALPWETGPWLPGSIIIQAEMDCAPCSHHVVCPHVMCRERISPDLVAAASLELLQRAGWPVHPPIAWESVPGARVWETVRDASGLQDLQLMGSRLLKCEEIVARAYRRMWLEQLGVPMSDLPSFAVDFATWCSRWDLPSDPAELLQELEEARGDLDLIRGMADSGLAWVARVDRELKGVPRPHVLEECIKGIVDLDQRIYAFELSRPLLRPLGVLFRFEKEELREEDSLERLGGETTRIYAELRHRSMRLADPLAVACRTLEAMTKTTGLEEVRQNIPFAITSEVGHDPLPMPVCGEVL